MEILNNASLTSFFRFGAKIEADASILSPNHSLKAELEIPSFTFGERQLYLLPFFKDLIASVKEKENAKQQATITTEAKRELLSKDTKIAIEVKNGAGEVVKKSSPITYTGSVNNGVVDETEAMAPEAEPTPIEETVEELVAEDTYVATPVVQSPLLSEEIQLKDKSVSIGVEKSLREQLIQLYKDTDGDNWKHNDNWCSDKPLEQWYGVNLVDRKNNKYSLQFIDNDLKGNIYLSHKDISSIYFNQPENLNSFVLEGCSDLKSCILEGSVFESIRLEGCTNLTTCDTYAERFQSLTISKCDSLKQIGILCNSGHPTITLKDCLSLEAINKDNHFPLEPESMNLINCPSMKYYSTINLNSLKQFRAHGCPSLCYFMDLDNDVLEYVDIKDCENLPININENHTYKVLKLRNLPQIHNIDINNQIDTLDLSGCINLDAVGGEGLHSAVWISLSGCKNVSIRDFNNSYNGTSRLEYLDISGVCNPSFSIPIPNSLRYLNANNAEFEFISLQIAHPDIDINLEGAKVEEIQWYNHSVDILKGIIPDNVKRILLENCTGEALDFSQFPKLQRLDVSSSDINEIKLYNQPLTYLRCELCKNLNSISLARLDEIKEIRISNNIIRSGILELGNSPELESIQCDKNNLTKFQIGNCPKLTWINCSYNQLTKLEFGDCPNLLSLSCGHNQLAAINLTPFPELSGLGCSYNNLSSINLSPCKELTGLNCSNNQLTNIDISPCKKLSSLTCGGNLFSDLTLVSEKLSSLKCSDSQNLKSMNLSQCPELVYIHLENNGSLTDLDMSNTKISHLSIQDSWYWQNPLLSPENEKYVWIQECKALSTLNVSNCSNLVYIDAGGSYASLTKLDITGCFSLQNMYLFATKQLKDLIMSDEPYENLKLVDAENSAVLHVIPDWFKISIFKYDLDHYRYEQRYTYTYKYVQDQYGNDVRVVDSVEDKGYGWWYPGEPESGEHKRQ